MIHVFVDWKPVFVVKMWKIASRCKFSVKQVILGFHKSKMYSDFNKIINPYYKRPPKKSSIKKVFEGKMSFFEF